MLDLSKLPLPRESAPSPERVQSNLDPDGPRIARRTPSLDLALNTKLLDEVHSSCLVRPAPRVPRISVGALPQPAKLPPTESQRPTPGTSSARSATPTRAKRPTRRAQSVPTNKIGRKPPSPGDRLDLLLADQRFCHLPISELRSYLADRGIPHSSLKATDKFWLEMVASKHEIDLEPLLSRHPLPGSSASGKAEEAGRTQERRLVVAQRIARRVATQSIVHQLAAEEASARASGISVRQLRQATRVAAEQNVAARNGMSVKQWRATKELTRHKAAAAEAAVREQQHQRSPTAQAMRVRARSPLQHARVDAGLRSAGATPPSATSTARSTSSCTSSSFSPPARFLSNVLASFQPRVPGDNTSSSSRAVVDV